MGKRLHVINFTLTILDEGRKAYSAEGNYCLTIFRQPESYDMMKQALSDILQEVAHLSICVNGQCYKIDYFLACIIGKPYIKHDAHTHPFCSFLSIPYIHK